MIGIDTNVLVRAIVADEPAQTAAAKELLARQEEPAFTSLPVVVELVWVLQRAYHFGRDAIVDALSWLLESKNISIEREELVEAAVALAVTKGADIADTIIASLAMAAGATHVATFDRDAAKRVPGMKLLK